MNTFSLGGFSRTITFRDREVEIAIDDFTWEEVDLFNEVAGVDLAQAFGQLLEPRLLSVALWLIERRTDPKLAWKAFRADVNPYRDIGLVLPEPDAVEADNDATQGDDDEREVGEAADPEA